MAREVHDLNLSKVPRVASMGIPDEWVTHGSRGGLLAELGLDVAGITEKIRSLVEEKVPVEAG
ncbi:MAG: hypothetical protein HOE14_01630 [Gemmatimonadales bacterium]|nr:hypothetical protein [Gemmatimonadales bacterium]